MDYVEKELPLLRAEATRVPDERAGQQEQLLFPGVDASMFGKQVKRVSGISVTHIRALVEEVIRRNMDSWSVPEGLVQNLCGHSEKVAADFHTTAQCTNNLKDLLDHIHDHCRMLSGYVPQKKAPRGRSALPGSNRDITSGDASA